MPRVNTFYQENDHVHAFCTFEINHAYWVRASCWFLCLENKSAITFVKECSVEKSQPHFFNPGSEYYETYFCHHVIWNHRNVPLISVALNVHFTSLTNTEKSQLIATISKDLSIIYSQYHGTNYPAAQKARTLASVILISLIWDILVSESESLYITKSEGDNHSYIRKRNASL